MTRDWWHEPEPKPEPPEWYNWHLVLCLSIAGFALLAVPVVWILEM